MTSFETARKQVEEGALHAVYPQLYGNSFNTEVLDKRYKNLIEIHNKLYKNNAHASGPLHLFSTAGRSELGGNHTDHNLGKVIAATINLDTIGAVRRTDDGLVILKSEGFPVVEVDLNNLGVRKKSGIRPMRCCEASPMGS